MLESSCNNLNLDLLGLPINIMRIGCRTVARTLIGEGVYSYIDVFTTRFFLNQIQFDKFEKNSFGQNLNI